MSWLDRLSELHGMHRIATAERVGIVESQINAIMLFPHSAALQGLKAATGFDTDQILAMTHQRHEATALWMLRGVDPGSSSTNKATQIDWIRHDSSHTCPPCLAASGNVWRLPWRLSWTFMCSLHRTFVASSCQCGRLLNQRSQTVRTAGCATCRIKPRDLRVAPVSDPDLIKLQDRLNHLVAGDPSPAAARGLLADFRSAMHLALYVGEPQMLAGRTDQLVAKRFAQACRSRDQSMFVTRKNKKRSLSSQFWFLRTHPPDALLLAGISLLAADLVFADDIDQAVGRFLDGCRMSSTDDVVRWERFGATWFATPRVRNAVIAAGTPLPTSVEKFPALRRTLEEQARFAERQRS